MKKAIVLCFALLGLLNTTLSAQNDTIAPSKIPAKVSRAFIGFGIAAPLGGVVAVGARNGFGVSLSKNLKMANAKNLPNDYKGPTGLFFGDGSGGIQDDGFGNFAVRLTKQFASGSKRIHWGIEAGPSFTRSVIADNFVPVPISCDTILFLGESCTSNYTYERIKHKSTGLSLKAKVGIEVFKPVLIELGGFYNRSANWTYFGVDIVGSLGVNKKISH
jgi:hypothetical protein